MNYRYRSGQITTHYSSAELQNLYEVTNKVFEKQKSGVVLTLLRNLNNRKKVKQNILRQLCHLCPTKSPQKVLGAWNGQLQLIDFKLFNWWAH